MIYVGAHETTMLRPSAGYRHVCALVLARSRCCYGVLCCSTASNSSSRGRLSS